MICVELISHKNHKSQYPSAFKPITQAMMVHFYAEKMASTPVVRDLFGGASALTSAP